MSVRRSITVVAALAATTIALSGCSLVNLATGGGTNPKSTSTHTNEQVEADLVPFYTQNLTWVSDGGSLDHTSVKVPLDWSDPTGDTITIAIERHKASHPLGSLLINPGGPGGSGYDFVRDSAQYIVTGNLLSKYDVIGFDPRGVNHSTPIVCFTDPKQQDDLLYGTYNEPYGTPQWVTDMTQREVGWDAACKANTGPLLAHIDAGSVARDMDVIRAVLGDTTMNYLGYSYGTYLGTMYAELFPTKVGKMVLDGAVDPHVPTLDELATQMAGFDSALKAYLADCLSGSKCPFTGSVADAQHQVRALLDGIDAKGLVASDGRKLDSATVGTGIAYDLYSQQAWPYLTSMFSDLFAGDPNSTFQEADGYNGRGSDGTYSDNASDVYAAVTCAEGTLGTDGVDTLGSLAQIDAAAPILGKYFAFDDTAVLDAACTNWPYPVAERPAKFDAPGAPPILVIGTTNDPATPYAQSVSLAKQLSSGVMITHNGEGHTVYAQGNSCINDTVDNYFISGTVPSSDPNC